MMLPEYVRPHNGADARESAVPVVGDGSNIFDPEENRNDVFSETSRTRNTRTFVPYRGNEQHGVEFNTPAEDYEPYESEQRAFDKSVDPNIAVRDLVPMKPVPVTVVESPDLLRRKMARITNTFLSFQSMSAPAAIKVADAHRFRTRLRIFGRIQAGSGTGVTAATMLLGLSPFVVPGQNAVVPGTLVVALNASADVANFAAADPLMDLAHTEEVYMYLLNMGGTLGVDSGVYVTVVHEYDGDLEGKPLL